VTHTAFPLTDRYGFPVEVCGRCGGTGQFSYNQIHGSRCYGCDGKKVRHTRKARTQFQSWAADLKAIRRATGASLQVGDELAIVKCTGIFTEKVVGWHTITQIDHTGEECGWSISIDPATGSEVRTPTAWRMLVTFDDGELAHTSTNSLFRRKGWIDPAPYVAKSQPRVRCTA
jgi:hypothetical protein